jgi:CheY-like chemotaxis protein
MEVAMATNPAQQRLLIVEDNAATREGLRAFLQHAGYIVIEAANGQEALDCLERKTHPDLVLLDMLMPVMDGWRFLEELARLNPPPSAPVIITTSGITTREWAVAHGAAGFVNKPIDPDELLREIKRCLRAV